MKRLSALVRCCRKQSASAAVSSASCAASAWRTLTRASCGKLSAARGLAASGTHAYSVYVGEVAGQAGCDGAESGLHVRLLLRRVAAYRPERGGELVQPRQEGLRHSLHLSRVLGCTSAQKRHS